MARSGMRCCRLRWLTVAIVTAHSIVATAACAAGDLPCACKDAGGNWRDLKDPLKPVCTFELKQQVNGQDMTRTFNVFLPDGYQEGKSYPVWMHIHGVYWGSMDGISQRMGWNVLAMDATANWDGLVGSNKVKDSTIVVYPQSTPSPYTNPDQRMLWNLPWWSCSAGSCVDKNIDEIEYMETVIRAILSKFKVDKSKFWVTGTSAGGMMVNYLLCKSQLFVDTATSVVDILGGVGESFTSQCQPKKFLPHLILHGMNDPIITYDRDNVVDGSTFISTLKMAKWWQGLQGCPGEPRHDHSDNTLECSIYCEPDTSERALRLGRKHSAGSSKSKKQTAKSKTKGKSKQEKAAKTRQGRPASTKGHPAAKHSYKSTKQRGLLQASKGPILELCGMKGVGHDLNTPYHGYPFDVAWNFLKKQSGM